MQSVQAKNSALENNQSASGKEAVYSEIRSQLKGIIGENEMPWEAGLVSLIALIKQHMPVVSWVGLYRNIENHLWVGPYQGKLACIHLKPGQGVCGQTLIKGAPVIVDDVTSHPGHVACDDSARSEIVLPVYRDGKTIGVLDLDSHELAAFDTTDQKNLEDLLKAIEPLPEQMSY